MTQESFTAFYPQFSGFTPAEVLSAYVSQANRRFSAFEPEDAEEARRLYAAHKLTLYARTSLPENVPPDRARIAEAGQAKQRVAGKKAGEVSVTYAAGASSAFSLSAETADLAETDFGLQLLALVSRYRRPVYVP